jgi:hypothetical protein
MTCIFSDLFDREQFRPYDPSQEPIFPPELRLHSKVFSAQSLVFKTDRMLWLRPTSLEDILHLKKKFPDAKIVVGNTELGVEIKFKKCYYPVMIQPSKVNALWPFFQRKRCHLSELRNNPAGINLISWSKQYRIPEKIIGNVNRIDLSKQLSWCHR